MATQIDKDNLYISTPFSSSPSSIHSTNNFFRHDTLTDHTHNNNNQNHMYLNNTNESNNNANRNDDINTSKQPISIPLTHPSPNANILHSDHNQVGNSNTLRKSTDNSISNKKHDNPNNSNISDSRDGARRGIEHRYERSTFSQNFNIRQDRSEGVLGIGDKENEKKSSMDRYAPSISSIIDPPRSLVGMDDTMAKHNIRLEKAGIYLTTAALQAYTILSSVRCLADPTWVELTTSSDVSGGREGLAPWGNTSKKEKWFLGFAIVFTLLSFIGVTLRILEKSAWLRRVPIITVITAYLQAIFGIATLISFMGSHKLPPGTQYSHGFLTCVITVVLSVIVAIMLTVDWWNGFPSAGLSATLKQLIVSSFIMTFVFITGAATYSWLENWTFDESVNFCIVSFSTIGYGNISPRTSAGRIVFFFFGTIGVVAVGFFILALRNSVIEQLESQLIEKFSMPNHMIRVHYRMATKDLSYSAARFEEEKRVKANVKRTMITRMIIIWVVFWFGGAGVFCTLESWTYLESLYFCYVTLTTIGFGDFYPTQPGSIEFWNIYVLMGLTIFAYILSLLSDTMTEKIQLADDNDSEVDDENFFAWEQRDNGGDPNISDDMLPIFITSKFDPLGLNGNIWQSNHHERVQIYLDDNDYNDITDISQDIDHHQYGQSFTKQQSHHRFWGFFKNESLNERDLESQLPNDSFEQSRDSNHIRAFRIPGRRRNQMLQAEYYATKNALPDTTIVNNNSEQVLNMAQISRNESRQSTSSFGTVSSYISQAQWTVNRLNMSPSPDPNHPINNLTLSQLRRSHTYGALEYREVMARRRRSLLAARNRDIDSPTPSISGIPIPFRRCSTGGLYYNSESNTRRSTPASENSTNLNNMQNSNQQNQRRDFVDNSDDTYLKTNALQHNPQVHFETIASAIHKSPLPQEIDTLNESPTPPIQRIQQDSPNPVYKSQMENINVLHSDTNSLSSLTDSLLHSQKTEIEGESISSSKFVQIGEGGGSFSTLNSPSTDHDTYSEERAKMYERYLELEHTRMSNSSDTTKVGGNSPSSTRSPMNLFMSLNKFTAKFHEDQLSPEMAQLDDTDPSFPAFCKDGTVPTDLLPRLGGEYGSVATKKRPPLGRLWSTTAAKNALGLSPIREQKSWGSSS